MNLPELMIELRDRPEAFLRDDCIFQLRAFIRGFILARNTAERAISIDHKLLEAFDLELKSEYGVEPSERVSVEELLDEIEKENAFAKYIELWFKYAQG